MKNIITLILALSLTLSANSTSKQNDAYAEALKAYNDKQYELAFSKFATLLESDYGSIKYNYYLARSAFFLKNYDETISAYERILISHPDNIRSKLELGRTYFVLKEYEQARKYFNEVLKSNIPQNVRKNVNNYIAVMDEKMQRHSISGMLMVGVMHDSNINNNANPYIEPYINLQSDIAAWSHQEIGVFNHVYDKKDDWGGVIKNDIMLYSKSTLEHTDKNVRLFSYSPAYTTLYHDVLVDYALNYSRMWYGGKYYLQTYAFNPKLAFNYQENLFFTTSLKFEKKEYAKANKNRNSKYFEFLSIMNKQESKSLSWNIGLSLQAEKRDGGNLVNVDFDAYEFTAGVNYLLAESWNLGLKVAYKDIAYKYTNIITIPKQHDKNRKKTLTLSKSFNNGYVMQLNVDYIENDSNLDAYSYNKKIFGLNFIKIFDGV